MTRKRKRLVNQLMHPISIIQFSEVKGSMGEPDLVESVFLECRAGIWPLKAGEAVENMRTETEVTHRVRIRYYPGVTTKMIVRFGSRDLEIKGIINPNEANKVLDLVCNE